MLAFSKYSTLLFCLLAWGCSNMSISGDNDSEETVTTTFYKAVYKKGKLNGSWQSWYPAGQLCDSGRFVNNLPTGLWKFWDAQGKLIGLREYSADKYKRVKAEFVRYNPKLATYHLSYLYSKNRKEALQYMESSYSFPQASIKAEEKSLKDIVESNVLSTGPYSPVFKQCLHDGLYINYTAKGEVIDSGYYKNGLRSGIWYHKDAASQKVFEGAYENGRKVKQWKVYNTQHRLLETITYDDNGFISWTKQIVR